MAVWELTNGMQMVLSSRGLLRRLRRYVSATVHPFNRFTFVERMMVEAYADIKKNFETSHMSEISYDYILH